MSLSKALKRKVDSEGRTYKEEWKEKYAFILPEFINAKPVCLICNEVVAVCKEYNIRRHHDTKHGTFKVAYPLQTGTRRHKLEALTASYAHSSKILVRGLTAQQKVTSASLKAAWVLARHNRPFTDGEIFKEVMVAVLEELATDKSMDGVIASVKQVPLSARSATWRIDALSDAVHGVILSGLSQANYFSVAIDESTDNTDVSQMCVYVRYFDGKEFREELLSLIPLEGNTTGEIIFTKLEEVFRLYSLSFEKINLIVTDGAPAMLGKHREDASHDDLLLHNDVRWLSKGKALERFCALLDEVKAFLRLSKMRAADDHLAFLQDEMSMSNVAFLTDIFGQPKQLNLQLQGRGKTIVDMVEKMESFTRKLELFQSDLLTGRLLHFSTLTSQVRGEVTGLMVDFIKQLRANFKSRFEDYSIPRDIVAFVRDPLTVRSADFSSLAKETIPLLNEAAFQMELIDFQTTSLVSDALKSAQSVDDFWMTCSDEYSWIKKLAFYVLTMFPSTYTCETAFSSMKAIKTHKRNRLTHKNLENCLRVKVTSISPDIQKIVTEGRCQFSH
ncbi:general transcription factor II-I repeat domain-containing protein 2-like [Cololabis saira]|uniref:general transcription factor II-I repeat domain-containing protein 2-like n=1 Tax=Cololabis saira TaxID=129043 RepID=UPI002AD31074|nr:general transcription factor II-I repeat domain-containing protein 2-like [Cololabis saira]